MKLSNISKLALFTCLVAGNAMFAVPNAQAQQAVPAKKLFGAKKLPSVQAARSFGFYSKGCVSGAIAIPVDGPNWQAMRLERNRRWGHPDLVKSVEILSRNAARDGWRGLLVGDLSQPRGGPMLTGHRSHQIGLDADIWLMEMPTRRLTVKERRDTSAISVLKRGTRLVDDAIWTKGHEALLRNAAKLPKVERLLVHPGIKKKLCDTVTGDRSWLHKVRPYYGHHYHFHMRIGCPPGSPGCRPQAPTGKSTGCGAPLAWWFTKEPWTPRKRKPGEKPKKRRVTTLSDLPNACATVLSAPGPTSIADVTLAAPRIASPVKESALINLTSTSTTQAAKAIEQNFAIPTGRIAVPSPRPAGS